jgi:hypothetical protein
VKKSGTGFLRELYLSEMVAVAGYNLEEDPQP